MTTTLRTMPTVPMMYSTPIQTAAFRSALMPGFPGAAAIVRFVFMLYLPVVVDVDVDKPPTPISDLASATSAWPVPSVVGGRVRQD